MAYLLDEAESVRRENDKAVKALEQDCDPGPLMKLGKRCAPDKRLREACDPLYSRVLFNYADAAFSAGLDVMVLGLREGVREDDSIVGADFWASYWLCKSRCHRLSEHWGDAAQAHGKAMEYFKKLGTEEAGLRWFLCANGYAIQLHYGQIEGMEERMQALLRTAPTPRCTVECNVLLGKYYIAAGRPTEAGAPLEYAAEHGNKLFAKFEAEELLRELDGKGPSDRKRARDAKRKVESVEASPCDPTPTLEACEEALADEGVCREVELCSVIRLEACTALVNLGRYDEARAQMEQMWLGEELEEEPAIKILRLHRDVIFDTAQGHLAEAAQKQNEAMKLFRECGEPADWRLDLCNSGSSLQIKLGQLDGVEERAKWLLENYEGEHGRVIAHMLMGRYLLATWRKDEAVEHLQYVAEYGGKLHQQREAEELLKTL